MSGYRILYVSHDAERPAGGVRAVYWHVHHLRQAGFPAFVVQTGMKYQASWFKRDMPILSFEPGLALAH